VLLITLHEPSQLDRTGQPGRSRADDQHVHLDRLGAGRVVQDEAIEWEGKLMTCRHDGGHAKELLGGLWAAVDRRRRKYNAPRLLPRVAAASRQRVYRVAQRQQSDRPETVPGVADALGDEERDGARQRNPRRPGIPPDAVGPRSIGLATSKHEDAHER